MTDPQHNPPPNPDPAPDAGESTRFAAYDKRLTRFVGGVHDSETAARKSGESRGVKGRDLEIRKV